MIDDASTDNIAEIVRECAVKDARIELIRHEKNCGPGYGIITGYKASRAANYDITVVVGGDYQMPLDQVENFLKPLINGETDYTKGNRFMYRWNAFEDMPKLRLFADTDNIEAKQKTDNAGSIYYKRGIIMWKPLTGHDWFDLWYLHLFSLESAGTLMKILSVLIFMFMIISTAFIYKRIAVIVSEP